MLEEGHQVSESFMEGGNVGIGWLHIVGPDSVDDRVSRFVGDDVMGKAGKDRLVGKIVSRVVVGSGEVSEHNAMEVRIVVRVGFLDAVGEKEQLASKRRIGCAPMPSPVNVAAKRELEALNRLADDCIDHLLMESRVGFARFETLIGKNARIIEVDRLVIALVGGIVINDRDIFPNWATFEMPFKWDLYGHVVAIFTVAAWIEGEGSKGSEIGGGYGLRNVSTIVLGRARHEDTSGRFDSSGVTY